MNANSKRTQENTILILLAIVLWYLTYHPILVSLSDIYSDYNGHAYVYLPLLTGESWIQGWKAVPYCLWHLLVLGFNRILRIPFDISVAYAGCFFALLSYFILFWIIKKFTLSLNAEESSWKAALLSFGFCILQSIFLPWLDTGNRFLGLFSMNPTYNPTHMAVRPFSLLCICFAYDILRKQEDNSYRGTFLDLSSGLKRPYIYLSLVLFVSVVAKPTFAEMFIPAVGIVMLIEWFRKIVKKDGSASVYFKNCLHMLFCALPALAYILLQFLAYFIWDGSYEGDGGLIITQWLEVWRMFSENVVLSVILALSMPLLLLLTDARFFFKDTLGRLALTGYIIGFLEAALLGEGGGKLSHGNFLWPMMSGLLLMWFASLLRLLALERSETDTKASLFIINSLWLLFWIHVIFGLIYIRTVW